MNTRLRNNRRAFEIMLIVVTISMTFLVYRLGAHKLIALNLFFLPIVLAGYYLGRTTAGVLALLAALSVTIVTTLSATGFASYTTPAMIGLALTLWAAILGLTALLVGTLCDERARTVAELHDAYVGVVEVVTKYLQSADPRSKARVVRLAELCQSVAEELRLSRRQIDDVRVGSLLQDMGNVEITTQIISKAVDTLESRSEFTGKHTFHGQDLAQSLGAVLRGAVPLLIGQEDPAEAYLSIDEHEGMSEPPLGAKIIHAVRAFDAQIYATTGEPKATPEQALAEMHREGGGVYDLDVLAAIDRVVSRTRDAARLDPVAAF